MKVVVMAGGYGTRLQEETVQKPKPMVDIGEYPMLMHIMKYYASFDFSEFVVACGYRGELVMDYFLNYHYLRNGLTIDMANGSIETHDDERSDRMKVHVVDTGLATQTGGRLRRLQSWLQDGTFMMTYGDGLCDVDLNALLAFHRSHGKIATVTAVHPVARFGALELDGDRVREFTEKSQAKEGWINGGYFVLEPEAIRYIDGDEIIWEREPLERLAAEGQLMAYRHEGNWQPMDTLRDKKYLESLWASGDAFWKPKTP